MKGQRQSPSKPMQALREIALRLPEVEEGLVCNRAAFKARNKAFLFMGANESAWDCMVKLRASLPEAAKLADKDPACCKVGANGWVTVTFGHEQTPPLPLLGRWIGESYQLLVHKQLVALLDGGGSPKAAEKGAVKKKARSR